MYGKTTLANAFALATAILWVGCSAFVYFLPDLSTTIAKWWMHGLDVSALGSWSLTLENFLLGGAALIISLWICGYIFGWSLEVLGGGKAPKMEKK